MTYKIEKGVPVPSRGLPAKPIPYPFGEMELGDSFVVPIPKDLDGERLVKRILSIAKRYRDDVQADFAISARVRPEGVRVWRVKYAPCPARRKGAQKVVPPRPASYTHLLRDDDDEVPSKRVNGRARA